MNLVLGLRDYFAEINDLGVVVFFVLGEKVFDLLIYPGTTLPIATGMVCPPYFPPLLLFFF